MSYDEKLNKLLLNDYAHIQRIGFRLKMVCIKCGVEFDIDNADLAI